MKKVIAAIVVLCALWFYGGILVGHAIGTRQTVDRMVQAETRRESMRYKEAPYDHERVKRQWAEQAVLDSLYAVKLKQSHDTTIYVNGDGDTTIVITGVR